MSNTLSTIFTGILVICALIVTVLVARHHFLKPEPQPQLQKRYVNNWESLSLEGYPDKQVQAPIQLIEFFDYQCPFCKRVQPNVESIRNKYADKLNITYAHYPLSSHEHAFKAAIAAECARKQDAFKAYHELLFANQARLHKEPYDSLALVAGVPDQAAFSACVNQQDTASRVHSGNALAQKLSISGIPAFIINGTLVSGALSEERLEQLILEAE